jgi:hypothetical protein
VVFLGGAGCWMRDIHDAYISIVFRYGEKKIEIRRGFLLQVVGRAAPARSSSSAGRELRVLLRSNQQLLHCILACPFLYFLPVHSRSCRVDGLINT